MILDAVNSVLSFKCLSFIILVPTCECLNDNTFEEHKYCQVLEESSNFEERSCYIKLPSNCKNIKNSTRYLGLQISEDACKGTYKSRYFLL